MNRCLHKVAVFITRPTSAGTELLLFRHPHAGIQIPAGSVEEGEDIDAAALREAHEESGLPMSSLQIVRRIGEWEEDLGLQRRAMLRRAPVYARPDPGSSNWAYLPRGITVQLGQEQDGPDGAHYALVTYAEGDRYPDPSYVSYQITGWVDETALAHSLQRHFYHLTVSGDLPEPGWQAHTDNHVFHPFWALLADLPDIVSPQDRWLPFIQQSLNYSFD